MPKEHYDNNNSGALFVNDRKETDNQPDFTGFGEIDHVPIWIKGWKKKSAKGQNYLSLAFSPKDAPKHNRDDRPADDDRGKDNDDLGF